MAMVLNILIGGAIFGYAGYTLWKSIKKSKAGKCAACSLQKNCSSKACHTPVSIKQSE